MPELEESARIAGEIIGMLMMFSPWVLIPSWVATHYQLGELAKCQGIRHSWLTWIPLVNAWVPGSLSARYWASKERKSAKGKLLVMRLVTLVLLAGFFWRLIRGLQGAEFALNRGATEAAARYLVLMGIAKGLIFLVPAALAWLAGKIMWYMALWDIYGLFLPKRHWWHLLLSLIPVVNLVAKPVFLRTCRNWNDTVPPGGEAEI